MAIDLTLSFPLLNALTVADIDIKADAALSAFSLKNAIGDVDLTDAVGRRDLCRLAAQRHRQSASSTATRSTIVWREQFAPRAPYRQRYELKGTIPAAPDRQGGLPVARALRHRAGRRHELRLPGRDQRHERAARPLRPQGRQGSRGAARLEQGSRHRRPADAGAEARAGRQARRRPTSRRVPTACRPRAGAVRRRQRRPAGRAAAAHDRPAPTSSVDWRRSAAGRRRDRACAAARSSWPRARRC